MVCECVRVFMYKEGGVADLGFSPCKCNMINGLANKIRRGQKKAITAKKRRVNLSMSHPMIFHEYSVTTTDTNVDRIYQVFMTN